MKYCIIIILLLAINVNNIQILIKKCLLWKNKLKISCGFINLNQTVVSDSYGNIEWFYTNNKIFKSLDNLCDTCNLKDELFLLERDHKYLIKYNDTSIFFEDLNTGELLESVQLPSCFLCILGLYKIVN